MNVLTYYPELNTEQASKAQLTNKTQLGEALYFRRTYILVTQMLKSLTHTVYVIHNALTSEQSRPVNPEMTDLITMPSHHHQLSVTLG